MNSRFRLISSVLVIGVIIAAVLGASSAFFSDKETSPDNTLVAGAVDLKIDNTSYYNGEPSPDTSWTLNDLTDQLFFNFLDVKPGDRGEDTISLHVDDNDAWACMNVELTKDDDATCTEPEQIDDPTCDEPDEPEDLWDGELGGLINFIFWGDDGDNVLEQDETDLVFKEGTASAVLANGVWKLADSTGNIWDEFQHPLQGGKDYYIGKAWCLGQLTEAPLEQDGKGADSDRTPANSTGGVLCDGSGLNNAAQSDILMANIGFSAIQSRHNPDFTCGENGGEPCFKKADLMLVLDRSGSINDTELATLKTAAKAFVDALALSANGPHAGEVSFATTANLDQHLTDNPASVKAVIDALVHNGFTDLKDALDLATGELANPGDLHDRPDLESPDYIILITDGNPNRPDPNTAVAEGSAAATAAKNAGITIYVVGVGSDVDTAYLRDDIATDPAHYFAANDFGDLSTILATIAQCPNE